MISGCNCYKFIFLFSLYNDVHISNLNGCFGMQPKEATIKALNQSRH